MHTFWQHVLMEPFIQSLHNHTKTWRVVGWLLSTISFVWLVLSLLINFVLTPERIAPRSARGLAHAPAGEGWPFPLADGPIGVFLLICGVVAGLYLLHTTKRILKKRQKGW